MNALVVAHPDDESLFFAGLVISRLADWTIICCSIPRSDPIRAYKFFAACDVLGAKARLLPFTETPGRQLDITALDLSGFDLVVTHGPEGEYGNVHHRALFSDVAVRCAGRMMFRDAKGDSVLSLTAPQVERKLEALRCYDHKAPADGGKPKWQALLDKYSAQFPIDVERYACA